MLPAMLMSTRPLTAALSLVTLALLTGACDSDPASDALEVRFAAVVGDAPARCGETFALGTAATPTEVVDLRFYVHDVRLVDADGVEVPLELVDDGLWQSGDVALLDFEDRGGACANGTPETRDVVVGRAPAGDYRGLAFRVGVPEELNHEDAATAPSPLNLSRMFWSWTGGYKYVRADLLADGAGWNVHLGATACSGNPVTGIACANGNRPEVRLEAFDLAEDVVVFDLAALLADSDLSSNAPPAAGCMSDEGDDDCPAVYARLGLSTDGSEPPPQTVFSRAEGR